MRALDLVGQRFGKLTVLRLYPEATSKNNKWECLCDCGRTSTTSTAHLRSGHTTSCGCYRVEFGKLNKTHGLRGTPEYGIWSRMRQRCSNKANKDYAKYGGRGIQVADRWLDFANFIQDLGRRPSAKHTLERLDVNGNYEPGNVIWCADLSRQAFNQNRKSNNRSGRSGVYKNKRTGKWEAFTFAGGTHVRHGSFDTLEDAANCRAAAELKIYGMVKPDQ